MAVTWLVNSCFRSSLKETKRSFYQFQSNARPTISTPQKGYFGNECSMIIYMMNKFIIALSSKIQLLILYDINTAVIFRQLII